MQLKPPSALICQQQLCTIFSILEVPTAARRHRRFSEVQVSLLTRKALRGDA